MDKDVKPLVSVIMPAYNAAKYINDSIESVQKQTFTNWELIVVDDGSKDSTAVVVKKLQETDNRIKYYYQSNKKQAAARNTGISNASGQWLAFLDADDVWVAAKLQQQLDAAAESNADVIFSSGYYLTGSKELLPYDSPKGKFSGIELYPRLFQHNYIAILSVMLKKSLVEQVGLQDESLQAYGCEDWDYWLRCCRHDAVFFGMEQRLFQYRFNSTGTSGNKLLMHMAECYVLFKNYDEKFLAGAERKKAKVKFTDKVIFIINELTSKGEKDKVSYYFHLLRELSSNRVKYTVAYILIKILKHKSKRFINYILYH
ncbi:glycosyltransferase family 2 protein [Segetibacter koreensis]|uniref:glycosyltransferase family 2 protein n=1 Tax=Segetibacter koreensis TaxID=398037 RepID=UPI00037CE0C0|nr:glycosyltransferase family 2 protein [Segetibacter koreensis]